MPAKPRREIERTPTGDDTDAFFAMIKDGGVADAQQTQSDEKTNEKATPRRGVRRQPTGDDDLELMRAIEADTDDEAETLEQK